MMRDFGRLFLGLLALASSALPVSAQISNQVPNFGVPKISTSPAGPAPEPGVAITDSYVGILDSAVPRNTVRTRIDLGYHDHQPTRAEFLQAKGGLPFSPGPPLRETNVDYQDWTTYFEYAPAPWFSAFLETPIRWLNPEANANDSGYGDMNFGFKLCTWTSDQFIATLQFRATAPTARPGLGTQHWTIEPALLAIYRPYDNIMVEGGVHYVVPVGGTDFAGELLRYGLGLSVGAGTWGPVAVRPVVEAVGYSVLGGQTLEVFGPDAFAVNDAADTFILNGYLGCRFGVGRNVNFYLGYGHCFTTAAWTRDFARIEFRLQF